MTALKDLGIALVRSAESPFTLDDVMAIEHELWEMSEADIEKSRPFPFSVQELAHRMTSLAGGNNFSADRAPFLPQLRHIVQELFRTYAVPGGRCLEIGPGPVAYAATRLLPFETIGKFAMLEISTPYLYRIRPKARAKGWKLYHGDVHTMNLGETFDVIFSLSSLDTTPFIREALANVYAHLKNGGVAFIVQDVFPCPDTLVAHEYFKRKAVDGVGVLRFGVPPPKKLSDEEFAVLWIENRHGERLPSWTYLRQELAETAAQVGFAIVENGVWCAQRSVAVDPKIRQYFGSNGYRSDDHTTLVSHIIVRPGHDHSVPHDRKSLMYAADVLVLKR